MVKITIGVPVYNSAKFIKQGLDSFANQTMDKNEFEVLCVDDCSKDNSVEIINSYKDKLNLNIIKLPQNSGGPGEPRNKIIEHAQGEYIFFVDSDDYIHENSLEKMYDFAKANDSDVLLVRMKGVNGRGVPESMFKTTEANADLYNSRLIYTLGPVKMFKTSLLRDNNITFPIGLKVAEDQIFTMKAYLKSKVISILSDQYYYYATLREGEHMNNAYVDPKSFFTVMSQILDEIYATDEIPEKQNSLASSFLNRHFHFSRTLNFSIKNTKQEEKERYIDALGDFVNNHVPKDVDPLTEADIQPRLALARSKDLKNYEEYERSLRDNKMISSIKDGQVYAQFECLKDYPEVNNINFTVANKLKHKLGNIQIKDDRLTFSCHVKHSFLSDELNETQQITAVLVHRDNKTEKFIVPTMYQPKTQTYMFEIIYDGLLTSVKDLGTWDLFIESKVDSYTLRGRIGNKREKYQYANETSFIGYNNLYHYRLTPYFTKPYDNFSIYTKKLDSLEKSGKFMFHKPTKQLSFYYPERNIVLPRNTVFKFKTSSEEYSLSPGYVMWDKKGTIISFNSPLNRAIKNIKFNEVSFNNLLINFKK